MQVKSSQETLWVAQDSKILKSSQVFLSVLLMWPTERAKQRGHNAKKQKLFLFTVTEKLLDVQIFQVHQQILFISVQASVHQVSTNSEELMKGLEYQNLCDIHAFVLFLFPLFLGLCQMPILALSTNETADGSCFTG